MSQHAVQQCTSRATVTVGERVDRLELRVRDRRMSEHGNVRAPTEGDEIHHERRHTVVVWRHEGRRVRRDGAASDPDLLVAELPCDVRCALTQKSVLHRDDRSLADLIGELQRGLHRLDVRDDELRIAGG